MSDATTPIRRASTGIPVADCANGLHVARLGSPCVCGDTGPTLSLKTKIVLGPERKLTYTAPH